MHVGSYTSFRRIIGVQSFKGSYRRSCWLNPILGEGATQLPDQRCGGYIDPISLNLTGYIMLDGTLSPDTKGYICPLGQVCKVGRIGPTPGTISLLIVTVFKCRKKTIPIPTSKALTRFILRRFKLS